MVEGLGVSSVSISIFRMWCGRRQSASQNVSRNALNADGSVRGISDAAIDNAIGPDKVASRIWEAVQTGKREIIIAEGMEANIPMLRAQDPEKLFDMVEAMVADGYARKISAQ